MVFSDNIRGINICFRLPGIFVWGIVLPADEVFFEALIHSTGQNGFDIVQPIVGGANLDVLGFDVRSRSGTVRLEQGDMEHRVHALLFREFELIGLFVGPHDVHDGERP